MTNFIQILRQFHTDIITVPYHIRKQICEILNNNFPAKRCINFISKLNHSHTNVKTYYIHIPKPILRYFYTNIIHLSLHIHRHNENF